MISINWDTIPKESGVYIWKGEGGEVLYVGKAKNLKSRMSQYFRDDLPAKNKLLMKNIIDFEIQICSSEIDALLLEENLINKFEPKYNIKIKAAKRYPYIVLNYKDDLKLEVTRTLRFKKKAKYFGPYPDGFSAWKIVEILKGALPLDECLKPNNGNPCLNYEMGRCLGKCKGEVNLNEKDFVANQVEEFFKGKTDYIENKIKERIEKNNQLLNFEESQALVEKLKLIEKLNEQKSNSFKDTRHRDIINYFVEDDYVSISIMFIRFGSVNLTTNFISREIIPDPRDFLESFVNRYYKKHLVPDEVILPFNVTTNIEQTIKQVVPVEGVRKELLDLTLKNAQSAYVAKIDSFKNKEAGYEESIEFLKTKVRDKKYSIIEMVDISSTMGSEQVGAIVRFKDGESYKEAYRKYIIKSTNKMDDYASTEEVVRRHFSRMIEDQRVLPDLFIVDGKHQLSNAKNIFEELGVKGVELIGLVKDENHKTNSIINEDLEIIELDKKSRVYLFLSRIQEEVHRFVITFHRKRREKSIVESKLDDFSFLNEKDKQNLFIEFKSIRKILTASETELRKVLTESKVQKFIKEK